MEGEATEEMEDFTGYICGQTVMRNGETYICPECDYPPVDWDDEED
jgi:hypothetical protein